MMFLWFPFLFVIPFAVVWAMRHDEGTFGCMNHAGHAQTPTTGGSDATETARRRLAQGEITVDEFEVIRRVLG